MGVGSTKPGQTTSTGVPRGVWRWGVLDALSGALWSGPTAAFLSAFAVELGAGGGELGLLLALNTLLANGLQLHGAQWTRRGRTGRRVYVAAIVARGSWLPAGAVPAILALTGHRGWALVVFLIGLIVSAVATAAANPAMGARAGSASSEKGRTRYLADRMMALWLGTLLGTAGMTGLLAVRPGPAGYALGFGIAAVVGLIGLAAYAALLREAAREEANVPAKPARAPFAPESESLEDEERLFGALEDVSQGDTPEKSGHAGTPSTVQVRGTVGGGGWWPRLARRLGAPPSEELGRLVLAAAVLQGGASMIGPASPIWLVHHLGAPSSYLGTVSLASSLAAIAAQRFWARWIDKLGNEDSKGHGPERVLGYAASAAALIPLGWALVWQPWIALVVSAYGGLAWGGYQLAMTARLLQLAPESERPAYLGTYAAAVGAASAVGSLIAGGITQVVPVEWIPGVFMLSFLVRGLGWIGLSRRQ
jgi:MFS family permease